MIVLDVYSAPVGYPSSKPRPKREFLNLIEGFGIENDKFGGKDLLKSVMVIGTNSYKIAKSNNIELPDGALGENILVDFDPHTLKIGDKIVIGEAILEVTANCPVCNHLKEFDSALIKILQNKRGIYCKIIKGGIVKKGNKIDIIKEVLIA